MEFIKFKRDKKRKKKRRHFAKKHRDHIKVEVKSANYKKSGSEQNGIVMKNKIPTMGANAFWENYKAAQEWQNRHNSLWWKSRCFSLEYENHFLKETIRDLIKDQGFHKNTVGIYKSNQPHEYQNVNVDFIDNENEKNDDTLEFQMNEDMMNFLAQSIQHKIELKNKKNREIIYCDKAMDFEEAGSNHLSFVRKCNGDAKLLYGQSTSRILAMETALLTSIEKHIDRSKPQYWPNIPLKL